MFVLPLVGLRSACWVLGIHDFKQFVVYSSFVPYIFVRPLFCVCSVLKMSFSQTLYVFSPFDDEYIPNISYLGYFCSVFIR